MFVNLMAALKKENIIEGWKILKKYLAPHKREVLILSIFSLVAAATNAAAPYLAGKIVDNISGFAVFYFIAVWFIIRLIDDLIEWRFWLKNYRLGGELESEYLIEGYSKLIELPMSFHKSQKMGDVTNRIARASGWLSSLAENVLINLAPQFLSILLALIFSFIIKPHMALILLAGIAIYAAALIRTAPRMARISLKMHRAYHIAYGDAYDSVLNVQSIKQATAEQYEKRKLHKNFLLRAYKFYYDMQELWGKMNLVQKILVLSVQLSIFLTSAFFIQRGEMTIGQMVMFNGYAAMFFGPFVILGNNWQVIQNGLIAIKRAEKILSDIFPENYHPKNAAILESLRGEVEFQNVSFYYSKKQGAILKNISLKVLPGKKVALVGESGVGKSTLVDLISYYYKPSSGKIRVDGHDIKNLDLKFLRSQIAVVPQEIMLFNDTIKNNIKYGSFGASDEAIKEAARLAHANEFIESFPKKYEQIVGERGIKLSMGQKQRVALARAFLRNPKILILDEPTSALDARSEKFIQESLRELMQSRTTFIIAHRLSTVRETDTILVLDSGGIAELGTHEKLIRNGGIYKKLYELQMGF